MTNTASGNSVSAPGRKPMQRAPIVAIDMRKFQSLFQGVVANEQIGHEVNQEQLPQRQTQVLLDEDGDDEQDGCDDNQGELFLQAVLVVMMLMFMLMMMFKMVFMFVLAALVMMMFV